MADVVGAFGGAEEIEQGPDTTPYGFDRSFVGLA